MGIEIEISTGSSLPIYRQIMDQVRRGVTSGRLAVGDRLPSVRRLAERLLVNPNTVARSYNELLREGLLESRHGRGVFVAARRQVYTRAERNRRLEHALETFVSEATLLDFDADEIRAALDRKLKEAAGHEATT
jgi:GntR family transcriptional regulator